MVEEHGALLVDDALLTADDELDRHPCMLPAVQLLEAAARAWQRPESPGTGEMPLWAKTLKDSLEGPSRCVRLFITKVWLMSQRDIT